MDISKIKNSIELIQKAYPIALEMSDYGFALAFSGGKDSVVLYRLAQMAGVKFKVFMNITTLDPPDVIQFVKNNYKDVEFIHPPLNFFKLIVQQKILPQEQKDIVAQS